MGDAAAPGRLRFRLRFDIWLPKKRELEAVAGEVAQFVAGEAEVAGSDLVFADEIGGEEGGIVGAEHDGDARIVDAAKGMRVEVRNGPGTDVARGTDFERDPALAQEFEQRGIVDGADTVADALAADGESIADAFGAAG